jgi:hypothetical protein
VFRVDDWEDLEGCVEQREDEGGVESDARHHWFGREHEDWSCKVFRYNLVEVDLDVIVWVVPAIVASFFA